jgi:hypothetical protein
LVIRGLDLSIDALFVFAEQHAWDFQPARLENGLTVTFDGDRNRLSPEASWQRFRPVACALCRCSLRLTAEQDNMCETNPT